MALLRGIALALPILLALAVPRTASATVTTSTRSVTYSPSVNTTVFTVTFPFISADDLVVTKITEATLAETTLVQGTDYRVTLPRGSTQGYITTTSAVTSAYTIVITRDVAATQETSFRTQGTFQPGAIENAFDKLTMLVQELIAGNADDATSAVASHVAQSDPHTQYAKLLGRSGGQNLSGGTSTGENLTLKPNAAATNGKILLGAGNSAYLAASDRLGLGTASPTVGIEVTTGAKIDTGYAGGGVEIEDATILKQSESGYLHLLGGTGGPEDAGIYLYGSSHATYPNELHIDADVIDIGLANGGGGYFTFDVGTSLELNAILYAVDSDGVGDIYGSSSANEGLFIGGTSNADKGFVYIGDDESTPIVSVDEDNTRVGINDATPDAELDVVGSALVSGDVGVTGTVTGLRKFIDSATVGAAYTVVAPDDCGAVIEGSDAVVTLPNAAAGNKGCQVTIMYTGADGVATLTVRPHSSDGIEGSCVGVTGAGAATVVEFSGTADKDARNTTANINKGDYITVYSDGTSKWWTAGCIGEWASEP